MKKFVITVLAVVLIGSCIIDRDKNDEVTVRIINGTEQTLVFSHIDNGGDARFYPVDHFTLGPNETYIQSQGRIGSYDPIVIAPVSMDIDWNGKSIRINSNSSLERNPCNADHWWHYSNIKKYGPGVIFEFEIMDADLEQWFGGK